MGQSSSLFGSNGDALSTAAAVTEGGGVIQSVFGNSRDASSTLATAGALRWIDGDARGANRDFALAALADPVGTIETCCCIFMAFGAVITYPITTARLSTQYINQQFKTIVDKLTSAHHEALRTELNNLKGILIKQQQKDDIQEGGELTGKNVFDIIGATDDLVNAVLDTNSDLAAAANRFDRKVNPICETTFLLNRLIKGVIAGIKMAVVVAIIGMVLVSLGTLSTPAIAMSEALSGIFAVGKASAAIGGTVGFFYGLMTVRSKIDTQAITVAAARPAI